MSCRARTEASSTAARASEERESNPARPLKKEVDGGGDEDKAEAGADADDEAEVADEAGAKDEDKDGDDGDDADDDEDDDVKGVPEELGEEGGQGEADKSNGRRTDGSENGTCG